MNKTLRTVLIVGFHVFCIVVFIKGISLVATPDYVCNSADHLLTNLPIGAPVGCPSFFSAIPSGYATGYVAIAASFVFELLYWFIFRPWLVVKTHVSVLQKVIGTITLAVFSLWLIIGLIATFVSSRVQY